MKKEEKTWIKLKLLIERSNFRDSKNKEFYPEKLLETQNMICSN